MHCATMKPFFWGGGGGSSGHSVSALAKTTFPFHLTDTIILKVSFPSLQQCRTRTRFPISSVVEEI